MHKYLLNYLKRDRAYQVIGDSRKQYEGAIAEKLGVSLKKAKRMLKRDVWKNIKN